MFSIKWQGPLLRVTFKGVITTTEARIAQHDLTVVMYDHDNAPFAFLLQLHEAYLSPMVLSILHDTREVLRDCGMVRAVVTLIDKDIANEFRIRGERDGHQRLERYIAPNGDGWKTRSCRWLREGIEVEEII